MKHIILTISIIFGATAASAGSHSKDYKFPKKDCQEMFAGIGGLLEEADKEWSLALMMSLTLSRAASWSTSTLISHYSKAPGN